MKTKLASLFALALALFTLAPQVVACPRTQNSYGPPWYNDAWADHMPPQYQPDRGQPFREEAKVESPKQESKADSSKVRCVKPVRKCFKKITIFRGSQKTIRLVPKSGCRTNRVIMFNGTKRKVRKLNRVPLQPAKTDPPVAQPTSTSDSVAPPPPMNLIEFYKGNRKQYMQVK